MELSKFKLDDLHSFQNIFILGGICTGKTTFIKKLTKNNISFMWTPDLISSQSSYTFNTLDELPHVMQAIKRQHNMNNQQRNIVLDDIVEESDGIMSDEPPVNKTERWEDKEYVRELLIKNRHWGVNFILASRFILIQKPELQNLFGYVFIFPDTIRNNKKRLYYTYQYYLNDRNIATYEEYVACMNAIEDHHVLVIDYIRNKIFHC